MGIIPSLITTLAVVPKFNDQITESLSKTTMTPIKRKTRSQRQGEKFNVGGAWSQESEINTQTEKQALVSSTANDDAVEQQSMSTTAIDQIRAELFEERHAPSVESEYQDESHNWLDDETESEDYRHFLGRYE